MNPSDVWTELEKDTARFTGRGIIRRRLIPESRIDIFLGVELPSRLPLLLLRLPDEQAPSIDSIPHSQELEVRRGIIDDEPEGIVSLQLVLLDEGYLDVFLVLVNDITNTLLSVGSVEALGNKFLERLARWQKLFNRVRPDGLSMESQAGLFGELFFLVNYLLPILPAYKALQGWTGPDFLCRDFNFTKVAFEVKTTSTRQPQKIYVEGERQLDTVGLSLLFIFHVAVERTVGNGVTLPDMVSKVRQIVADNLMALNFFDDLLMEAGYLDQHAKKYSQTGYLVKTNHFYEIKDGFPRILESQLPSGVGDIQYSIAVSECLRFLVDEKHVRQTIEMEKQ